VSAYVAASEKAVEAGYPTTADAATDNPDAGVGLTPHAGSTPALAQTVAYRYEYARGAIVATGIQHAIITNPSPGASEPVLCHALAVGGAFNLISTDKLTVVWNHRVISA
jgi:hypothetical protein